MSPRGPRKDVVKVQIVKHGSKRLRAGGGRGGGSRISKQRRMSTNRSDIMATALQMQTIKDKGT